MGRFGSLTAQFFSRTDLTVALQDTQGISTRIPVSGSSEMNESAEGRCELIFAFDPYLSDLVRVGRVCTVYQTDAVLAALPSPPFVAVPFGYPFEIETVDLIAPGQVRVEGPDLLSWMKNLQVFKPVASATTTDTTVAEAVGGPAMTTVEAAAGINSDSIVMESSSGWNEGDEARITLDGSTGVHVTVVTAVNPPGSSDTIQIRDRLPTGASVGNGIERRRRLVTVAAGQGAAFQVGVECRLTMDNNSVHTTLIDEVPDGDVITMRDGVPDGAAVGKTIQATDYSQPTTTDVNTILNYVGWAADYESIGYTGTASGTHHVPTGESVYDLLMATARRSGEFFRLKEAVAGPPEKRIIWRRTHDYAGYGGNLRLVEPGQDDIDNDALNVNRGIITGAVRRVGRFAPITRVVPYAGDKRITLKLCSEGAKTAAMALGMTVVTTDLGLYTPPYVTNPAAEATWGIISRTITFSEIQAETENSREWQSAADELLTTTVAYMQEHGTAARYQYEVQDVVAALPIFPGQRVELVYDDPAGRWSVNKTGADALYVLNVRKRFAPPSEDGYGMLSGGVVLMSLTLGESPRSVPDMERTAARAIADVGRLARQGRNATGKGSTTTVVTGGSGSDHGALTGLGDDDHPQYVRTDGTRTMTGSLQLAAGLLVDGVDVSAHAADPNAHHAMVTPANTAISVVGQQVGVNLAVPSALEISNGLQLTAAAAGPGIKLDDQVLSVNLFTNSGLLLTDTNLLMGTPSTLTATTGNAVTGSTHVHSVTASSNPGKATQLVKTDTNGYLQLFSLGIGATPDGVSGLKVMSPQPTWYGLFLKQRGDQIAPMLRVENAAGQALVMLTSGGDLESGNPGFTSGLHGWQIAANGDAEFNNVRVRGELHATTFVADEMHASGGTLQIATASAVAEPTPSYRNELASMASATTWLVVNGSWATGLSYFAAKDVIRIKSLGAVAGGGSLYIPDIYLEVVAVVNLGDRNLSQGNPGRFALQCLRKSGGFTGYVVPTGSAVVTWTRTGQGPGAYKGNMLLTADLAQSPYLDVLTVDASLTSLAPWPGSGDIRTPPTVKPRVRVGNLDGVLGLPEQWGIAAGTDLSDTSDAARYLVASNLGVTLRNIDLSMYSGAERVIRLSPTGMVFRSSGEAYEPDRALRWERASGAVVGALAARSNTAGDFYFLELGLRPTFHDVLSDTGIRIYDDPTASGGTRVDILGSEIFADGYLSVADGITANNGTVRAQNGDFRTNRGLVLGGTETVAPHFAIRFKERTTAPAASGAGWVDIWVQVESGEQKLYVKFGNGVVKKLADSIGT